MTAKEQGLPELPPHKGWMNLHSAQSVQQVWGYTADQMRAYALAALRAQPAGGGEGNEVFDWAENELIRAGHSPDGAEMMAFYEVRALAQGGGNER